MINTVIFDMDGVLVNSEPYHFEVEKLILKKLGISITEKEIERFVGLAMDKMWGQIKESYNLSDSIENLVKNDTEFRVSYFSKIEGLKSITGVKDLIQKFNEKGMKIAVASSSHSNLISTVLEKIGLDNYFRECVSGFDVEHGKPYPDIFLKTASKLNSGLEECVVIEDSYNGVCGAKAAGMKCIGFRNPESGNQDLSAADLIIDSFTQPENIFRFIST